MAVDQDTPETHLKVNCYLNEPMLIRESAGNSLPRNIIQYYGEVGVKSQSGAMAVLLKVLMNELGYVEADRAALVSGIGACHDGQSLQMNFVYSTLEKSSFSLLLLPVLKTLFIHGLVRVENDESMNVKLPVRVSDFVNSDISGDIYAAYKVSNLPKFSRIFKDSVAYPLLQFALTASGLCSKPSLLTLVSELQVAVFKYLDVRSLLHLSAACSHLQTICKDRAIWRHMFVRDFGVTGLSAMHLKQDWKQLYREKYVQKQRLKKEQARFRDGHFGFVVPPVFPYGSEEDLYPFHFDPVRPLGPFYPQPPPLPQALFPQPSRPPFSGPFRHDRDLDPLSGVSMLPSLRPAVPRAPFGGFGGGLHFRFY